MIQPPAGTQATLDEIPISLIPAANVASVPQRSPLRYPGGKTWLIPHVRLWLKTIDPKPDLLIEPFAGGATVSLTAVMEHFAHRSIMAELDNGVACFWKATLCHTQELVANVKAFVPTRDAIERLERWSPQTVVDRGFRTLVLNRTRRGGILAEGAALTRHGENGKGVASRWYPETIVKRLNAIARYRDSFVFREADGLTLLEEHLSLSGSRAVVFADPPYTVGGKRAGTRLYKLNYVDHGRLFFLLANSGADFLMTYDKSPEILNLVETHGFSVAQVLMKNTHHASVPELLITRTPVFC